jgi:hypothetical protein
VQATTNPNTYDILETNLDPSCGEERCRTLSGFAADATNLALLWSLVTLPVCVIYDGRAILQRLVGGQACILADSPPNVKLLLPLGTSVRAEEVPEAG